MRETKALLTVFPCAHDLHSWQEVEIHSLPLAKPPWRKKINTKITAGRCLFCLNSPCSAWFSNMEILGVKLLLSPSSHPKALSSAMNEIQPSSSWKQTQAGK